MEGCYWLLEDGNISEYDNTFFIKNEDDSEYSDEEPEPNNDDYNSNDEDFENYDNCDINCDVRSNVKNYYLSKNKSIQWNTKLPTFPEIKNMFGELPGVKGPAKQCKTPLECWEYYFPPNVINDIVKFTNIKLKKMCTSYGRPRDCSQTDIDEIKAVFGLLYLAVIYKMSYVNMIDLWSTDGTAPELFRYVMSYKRFSLLLSALRFDDVDSRRERLKIDKFAPIRDLWDHFNLRCQDAYIPGKYCTIDKVITSFRGRSSFKEYISSKSNRYGLKYFLLSDAQTFYVVKLEMHIGNQPAGPYQLDNRPASIVKRMAQPILHTGRNITMDNWFISIPLIKELVENYRTTVVGTVRKNQPEIPPEFVNPKKRNVNSAMCGFHDNLSLVSYIPERNKCVVVISSVHQFDRIDIDTAEKKKREIITFYNKTKNDIHVADKLKTTSSIPRYSSRWPLSAFFILLDVGVINSSIIYHCNIGKEQPKKPTKRNSFLKDLSKELMERYLKKRISIPTLSYELRNSIARLINAKSDKRKDCDEDVNDTKNEEIGRCYICPSKKNRKSKSTCIICSRFLCTTHTIKTCVKCYSNEMFSDTD